MIDSRHRQIAWIAFPIALVLSTSGCATKKYVKQQVSPVHQQVAALEKHTNDKVAYLNGKEERDISQVNEKIATVAEAAQQAQGTASRAMDTAEANSGKIAETATSVTALASGVANAMNFQLVEKADILFGFNQSTLTPQGKKALDEIVSQARGLPRVVVELAGFTDRVGSKSYNYALSRRRAETVQRYLVQQKIALRDIHIVGLGEERPLPDYAPEAAGTTAAARRKMERRTQVRLFGAGDITEGTASREK
jgi:outer membrane protein OmpA-like peptidoglycan-associated protein